MEPYMGVLARYGVRFLADGSYDWVGDSCVICFLEGENSLYVFPLLVYIMIEFVG